MDFRVEVSYPHHPDDRFSEQFDCGSAVEAGNCFEEYAPLDSAEVAAQLEAGEAVEHEDVEQGFLVSAHRVGKPVGSAS